MKGDMFTHFPCHAGEGDGQGIAFARAPDAVPALNGVIVLFIKICDGPAKTQPMRKISRDPFNADHVLARFELVRSVRIRNRTDQDILAISSGLGGPTVPSSLSPDVCMSSRISRSRVLDKRVDRSFRAAVLIIQPLSPAPRGDSGLHLCSVLTSGFAKNGVETALADRPVEIRLAGFFA